MVPASVAKFPTRRLTKVKQRNAARILASCPGSDTADKAIVPSRENVSSITCFGGRRHIGLTDGEQSYQKSSREGGGQKLTKFLVKYRA